MNFLPMKKKNRKNKYVYQLQVSANNIIMKSKENLKWESIRDSAEAE